MTGPVGHTRRDFCLDRHLMTNRIAITLGALILGGVALDVAINDSAALVFAGRKLVDLIEYLAFWR